jgi:hypothetical protein
MQLRPFTFCNKSRANKPKKVKIGDRVFNSYVDAAMHFGTTRPTIKVAAEKTKEFRGMKVERLD